MAALLEMHQITKQFGAVKALDGVSLQLEAGEVMSLCGENGSGKSTLMKILCGLYPTGDYQGEIRFAGEPLRPLTLRDTERKGIVIIHQELALVRQLTVMENIFLGSEITRYGAVDDEAMALRCQTLLAQVKLNVSPDTRVSELGMGQQQLVEIARALNKQVRLLILDEPTSSLTGQETETLLSIIQNLRDHGIACIYISHKLNEVKAISDSVCVIRDGKHIATRSAARLTEEEIITLMVGRELTALYPREPHPIGPEVLRVEHLTAWHPVKRDLQRVKDVSFSLRQGEILGIAGLVGAGRTELVSAIFGAYDGRYEGEVWLNGQRIDTRTPLKSIRAGLCLVPEDRKRQGIIPDLGVGSNITLTVLDRFAHLSRIDSEAELSCIDTEIARLQLKTSSPFLPITGLSGGNQQKAVLSKMLLARPKVLILDEPTRGVDVGAKFEIYRLIGLLAAEGVAIVMVSSELAEVLGVSDRVLVLGEGRLRGDFPNENLTQERVLAAALGTTERAVAQAREHF